MDDSKFCTGCGKSIEPGMQFCPQCGKVVSGSAADKEMKEMEGQIDAYLLESKRIWLMFFLAVYIIPVLIFSIFTLIDASNIASTVWSSEEFQKWIHTHGLNYDQSDIQNYITTAAGLALASGICAAVSLVCLKIRKYWIVSVVACIIAAMLCFWSVFGIIIGFLVAWMIIGAKDVFDDQPKAVQEE